MIVATHRGKQEPELHSDTKIYADHMQWRQEDKGCGIGILKETAGSWRNKGATMWCKA